MCKISYGSNDGDERNHHHPERGNQKSSSHHVSKNDNNEERLKQQGRRQPQQRKQKQGIRRYKSMRGVASSSLSSLSSPGLLSDTTDKKEGGGEVKEGLQKRETGRKRFQLLKTVSSSSLLMSSSSFSEAANNKKRPLINRTGDAYSRLVMSAPTRQKSFRIRRKKSGTTQNKKSEEEEEKDRRKSMKKRSVSSSVLKCSSSASITNTSLHLDDDNEIKKEETSTKPSSSKSNNRHHNDNNYNSTLSPPSSSLEARSKLNHMKGPPLERNVSFDSRRSSFTAKRSLSSRFSNLVAMRHNPTRSTKKIGRIEEQVNANVNQKAIKANISMDKTSYKSSNIDDSNTTESTYDDSYYDDSCYDDLSNNDDLSNHNWRKFVMKQVVSLKSLSNVNAQPNLHNGGDNDDNNEMEEKKRNMLSSNSNNRREKDNMNVGSLPLSSSLKVRPKLIDTKRSQSERHLSDISAKRSFSSKLSNPVKRPSTMERSHSLRVLPNPSSTLVTLDDGDKETEIGKKAMPLSKRNHQNDNKSNNGLSSLSLADDQRKLMTRRRVIQSGPNIVSTRRHPNITVKKIDRTEEQQQEQKQHQVSGNYKKQRAIITKINNKPSNNDDDSNNGNSSNDDSSYADDSGPSYDSSDDKNPSDDVNDIDTSEKNKIENSNSSKQMVVLNYLTEKYCLVKKDTEKKVLDIQQWVQKDKDNIHNQYDSEFKTKLEKMESIAYKNLFTIDSLLSHNCKLKNEVQYLQKIICHDKVHKIKKDTQKRIRKIQRHCSERKLSIRWKTPLLSSSSFCMSRRSDATCAANNKEEAKDTGKDQELELIAKLNLAKINELLSWNKTLIEEIMEKKGQQ